MTRFQPYLKALFGAALAALGAAQTAYLMAHHIGWQGGIGIAIAAVTVLAGVWGVPNGKSV